MNIQTLVSKKSPANPCLPILLGLVVFFLSMRSEGETVTWTGANSTLWNVAGNWNGGIPATANLLQWDSNSTLNLSGSNNYSGLKIYGIKVIDPSGAVSVATNSFTIEAGGIDMSSATQNLSITPAVTFNTSSIIDISANRTLTLGGTNVISNGTVTLNLSGNYSQSGQLTVANSSGQTAALTINNGGNITSGASIYAGYASGSSGTITLQSGIINKSGGVGNQKLYIAFSGDGTFIQNSGTLNHNLSIASGSGGNGYVEINGGNATIAFMDAGAGSNSTATLHVKGGNVSVGSFATLASGLNSQAHIILAGGSTTLPAFSTTRGVGATADLVFDGGVLRPTANSATYMSGLANAWINNGGAIIDTNTYNITISQALSNGVAANTQGTLAKQGAGTLTLNGSNTYSGATTVSEGTLALSNLNALQNSTLNTGSSGAQLVTFSVAGSNTYNLGGLAGADALIIGNNTISVGSNNATTSYSGNISGTGGSLTKVGGGSLLLSGNNTYTGITTINAGTLSLATIADAGVAGTLGNATNVASNLVLSGGTLEYSGAANGTSNRAFTLANGTSSAISVANSTVSLTMSGTSATSTGSLAKTGNGTLILSGVNTYSGSTTLSAGALQVAHANALGIGGNITFSGGSLQFGVGGLDYGARIKNSASAIVLDTNGQSPTFSGAMDSANTGGLAKNGTGTLSLSGANTYTGGTTINAGTLSLSGASGSIVGNVAISSGAVFQLANTADTNLSNDISGAGDIVHSSSSITTLSGTNTNAGSIQSSGGGTLLFSGAGALSSNITGLSATNSSTLSFVDGTTRTITLGNSGISLSTAKLFFDIDLSTSASDRLAFTDAASLTGTNTVNLNFLNSISSAQTWTLLTAGSGVNGSWSLGSFTPQSGYSFSLSSNATSLWLTAAVSSNNAYWTGEAGNSWVNTNFSTTINGSASLSGSSLAGKDVVFAATGAGNLTTTLGGNYDMNTLDFSTPEVVINGDNTLTVASSAQSAINISATGNTTINANLAGAAGLTKSGLGTLTLGGNNSYTGGTSITGGTVVVGSGNAFGNSNSTVSLNPGSGNTISVQSGSAALSLSNNFMLSSGTATWDTNSNDSSLSGAISGAGALTKTGDGTLTLSGASSISSLTVNGGVLNQTSTGTIAGTGTTFTLASGNATLDGTNTYTGSTTISAGTLTLSGGLDNSTVTVNGGVLNQTSTGTIAGTGTTFTLASGNATLAGTNTYTGSTTVSAGTLTLSGGLNNSSVTVNGGLLNQTSTGTIAGTGTTFTLASGNATLAGTNTYTGSTAISSGTLEIASTGELAAGIYAANITNNGSLIYSGTNNQTLSGVISGTGALTQNNSSTLILSANNTYTGATTIAFGTLQIGANGTSGSLSSSSAISNNGTLYIRRSDDLTLANTINGNGNVLKDGAGTLTLSANSSYSGSTTISEGAISINSIGDVGSSSTIGSGSLIKIGNGSTSGGLLYTGGAATTNKTIDLSGTTGWATITNNSSGLLKFTSNFTTSGVGTKLLTLRGTGTGEIAGSIANNNSGGFISLTKYDIGTWLLSGNSTYTGETKIFGGTLSITSIKDVGAGASSLGAVTTTTSGTIALASGALRYTGSGDSSNRTINLSGTTGTLTIDQSGTGTLRFTSDFAAGGAGNKTLNLQGSTAGIGEITGAIINNSAGNLTSLTKNGSGTWILSGANTYSGGTTLNNGTLVIGNTAGLGTGNLLQSSSSSLLKIDTTGTVANNMSVYNVLATQNATLSGAITVNNTTWDVDATDTLTVSGAVAGTNGITKNGTGTLILSGNNAFTGATSVNNGTLMIGNALGLGTGNLLQGSSSSLLKIDTTGTVANNMSVYNVLATQNATLSGAITVNNATWDVDANDTLTVSGAVSGSGGITKNGTGTLILSGNNAFTGATAVNSGTLHASAANALGNSTVVNVNAGSLLVTAASAVSDSAAINLGGGKLAVSGAFNETVGLLTLSANSTIDLDAFTGTLRFGGVGSWASGATLAIWNWNGINQYGTPVGDGAANRHVVFTSDIGLDSYLDRISFYSGSGTGFAGTSFEVGFSGGGTEIIAVPEPEVFACAILILLGYGISRIRRRAKPEASESLIAPNSRLARCRALVSQGRRAFRGRSLPVGPRAGG